jgi:hypothetical protein
VSDSAPQNVPASIRDRLLRLARERGEDHQQSLTRYAGERLLYRLCLTPHRDRFVLKGAKLFELWTGDPHRPTRDLDFLGYGDPDVARLIQLFQEICRQPVLTPDGLTFPVGEVKGMPMRETQDYRGASLKLVGKLGEAVIPLQVDFGFGDAITPEPTLAELPTLLGHPPATLWTYPRKPS